jgi:Zn-dependent M28 family amino/carboxypeptidase
MRLLLDLLALLFLFSVGCTSSPKAAVPPVSGEKAMEHVRAQVAFGPRPPGSAALEKCRAYITDQLRGYGYEVQVDEFEAGTPYGGKVMKNLIARKGTSSRGVVALASHYDTKLMEGIEFVGANDPGSSAGLLIELARVLSEERGTLDYWFVFLDGEEAFVDWSTFDSTYGSRHLARRWQQDGTAGRIRALILLDMIGDRNLDILKESHSTRWLSDLVWEAAAKMGLQGILSKYAGAVEDDHLPFLEAGIPSVDIIDLNYGPGNSFHHTTADTLDKVSPESMEKVGRLVLAVLGELQKRSAAQQ